MTAKNDVVAKAVIFSSSGQVLLLRRSKTDDSRPGDYDFPGGGIEPGEEIIAGVTREISEEAGLDVLPESLTLFYADTEFKGGKNITRLLFWTAVRDTEVTISAEHEGYQWVAVDEALKLFPHRVYGAGLQYGLDHGLFQ